MEELSALHIVPWSKIKNIYLFPTEIKKGVAFGEIEKTLDTYADIDGHRRQH